MGWSWFCGWWVIKFSSPRHQQNYLHCNHKNPLSFLWSGDMFTVLEITVRHCPTKFWKWQAIFLVYDQTWWPSISPAHLELSFLRHSQSKVAYVKLNFFLWVIFKILSWFIKQKYKSNFCTLYSYYQCIIIIIIKIAEILLIFGVQLVRS